MSKPPTNENTLKHRLRDCIMKFSSAIRTGEYKPGYTWDMFAYEAERLFYTAAQEAELKGLASELQDACARCSDCGLLVEITETLRAKVPWNEISPPRHRDQVPWRVRVPEQTAFFLDSMARLIDREWIDEYVFMPMKQAMKDWGKDRTYADFDKACRAHAIELRVDETKQKQNRFVHAGQWARFRRMLDAGQLDEKTLEVRVDERAEERIRDYFTEREKKKKNLD